ncbi:MAG: hypothetical protein A3J29_09405 [Acidobacteria bacterium RIFCSPLOWO2_12_FULL_67_14b]|nr:MAG: hypothetical protein A3J29_09405 [Acidobacteria bacterium RIFCSPLOWO2_12_FULL_67_14b]
MSGLAACGGSSPTPTAPTTTTPPAAVPPVPTGAAPVTQIPGCAGAGTTLFDALPVALADFLAFRPLGFLSPPIHMFPAKHSAFGMSMPGTVAPKVPIRAPGRVWVKEIWEATFSTGGANYQVYVYPCNDVRVYFGHLATLSEKLLTEMQKVPASCNSFADGTALVTTCRHLDMAVPLESNEAMGTGPDTAGVDFGLVDFRRSPAAFIRLEHYDHFYPYWASPLDYFTADVRTQLAARTGSVFGSPLRTASPIGGSHAQDVAGTAQGNWFPPGVYHANTTDLGPMLGLASDYVDPSQPIMAIGSSIRGMAMGLYSFSVESQGLTNRAFRAVTADGNTYCFDRFRSGQSVGGLPLRQPAGVLLMSMPGDSTLRVELAPGSSCASASRAFTVGASTFER